MKRFVIVVDTQGDFMLPDGALAVAGADALIAPMRDWLAALSPDDTAGVLFTFDTHHEDVYPLSPEGQEFPIHCVRGTPGWDNVLDPALVPAGIPVWRLEKGVFDMWAEDGVMIEPLAGGAAIGRERFFNELKDRGVTAVTVIGVAADYCVKWTVEGLVERGFSVTVPQALTRGIHRPIEQVRAEEFAPESLTLA